MAAAIISAARLRELLDYDAETGVFRWRETRCGRAMAGAVAGRAEAGGYWTIHVDGRRYKAHRLAWLHQTGEWPPDEVDHINTVKADNRWINLRSVPRARNIENQRQAHSNNDTGYLGVTLHHKNRKYQARIQVDGRSRSLGYFDSPEEAHAAYVEAKRLLHAGCTI